MNIQKILASIADYLAPLVKGLLLNSSGDKIQHFLIGAALTLPVFLLNCGTNVILVGVFSSLGLIFGLAKEIYDYFHPKTHTADFNDLTATWAGAAVVFYIAMII